MTSEHVFTTIDDKASVYSTIREKNTMQEIYEEWSKNEDMSDKAVSPEVLNAHLQRIDQRFEASDKLTAERMEKMQAVIGKEFAELKGELKAMNARLDTIQQQYSWKIGWLGTLFTLCGACMSVYPLLKQYVSEEWIMCGFGVVGVLILLISIFRK